MDPEMENKVMELLKQYKIIPEDARLNFPHDEMYYDVSHILAELGDEVFIMSQDCQEGDIYEDLSDEEKSSVLEGYSYIPEEIIKFAPSAGKLENFVERYEFEDEDDPEGLITIAFDHDSTHYEWTFSPVDQMEYFMDIFAWGKSLLGDSLCVSLSDYSNVFVLPEQLMNTFRELEVLPEETEF